MADEFRLIAVTLNYSDGSSFKFHMDMPAASDNLALSTARADVTAALASIIQKYSKPGLTIQSWSASNVERVINPQ